MTIDAEFVEHSASRWALRTNSPILGQVLPFETIGAYVLYIGQAAVYVGRSDNCLLTRLRCHTLRQWATHVAFEPCRSPLHAFLLESSWFHDLNIDHELLNQVHPARPFGVHTECPHCSPGDIAAWSHALRAVSVRRADQVLGHEQGLCKNS